MQNVAHFMSMKAITLLLVVFLLVPQACQAIEAKGHVPASSLPKAAVKDRPIRDKWAVVIGIDQFKDKRIPHLQFASKDAKDFADFLVAKGNFAKDHVLLLTNQQATTTAIKEVIGDDWLPRRVLEDDVVLIFASTHGSPKELDVAGENFLIAYDTNVDTLFSTAIELQDLSNTIKKRTQCDRVVVFLDACNSGAADAGGKGLLRTSNFNVADIAGVGQIVVSSSDAEQRSWESKRYQNGVFTRRLIEALQTKGPLTKLSDAYSSLKDLVEEEVKFDRRVEQTPVMKMNWNGSELALMAPPARPRPTEPYTLEAGEIEPAASDQTNGQSSSSAGTANTSTQASSSQSSSGQNSSSQTSTGQSSSGQGSSGQSWSGQSGSSQGSSSSGRVSSNQAGSSQGSSEQATTQSNSQQGSHKHKTQPTDSGIQIAMSTGNKQGKNLQGGVAASAFAPGTIGIIPFGGPLKANIASSQGDLWGAVSNPQELMSLPETLSACIDEEFTKSTKLKDKIANHLRIGDGLRTKFPALSNLHSFNCNQWKADSWTAVGGQLGVSYVLTGNIDDISWYPTTFSNRYQVVVSARLIDCSTGQEVARVDGLTTAKAPWTGDLGGGKKYFEKMVIPDAAHDLVKEIFNQMKNKW